MCRCGSACHVVGLAFAQMRMAALLILFGALVTLANNIMSFSFHAYQAELYPTRIRALAVGFTYSWSRFSVIFSSFAIAFLYVFSRSHQTPPPHVLVSHSVAT